MSNATETVHATAIAYEGVGCLILGASGSGKSQLAAAAVLHGAMLVADDRVQLEAVDGFIVAAPGVDGAGVIEIRGMGLIRLESSQRVASHAMHLAIELGGAGATRLPEPQTRSFLGIELPFIALPAAPLPSVSGLLLYLQAMHAGRVLPADWLPRRIVGA